MMQPPLPAQEKKLKNSQRIIIESEQKSLNTQESLEEREIKKEVKRQF